MTDALSDIPPEPMTVDEFQRWLLTAPGGRYELSDGYIARMAAERARHGLCKGAAYRALFAAAAGLPCQVFPDGIAVRVDEATQREPDVALRCGDPIPLDAVNYDDPVIVIEVTSPSTDKADSTSKLVDSARFESLAHYLIIDPKKRAVIHYERSAEGFRATILPGGTLSLDPPGLTLDLDAILEAGG